MPVTSIFIESERYNKKVKMSTMILTHGDCDGICAGAIALTRFPKSDVFFTRPSSFFDDLRNIDADRIIILDIALNKPDIPNILEWFKRSDSEILYFDHHPLSDETRKSIEKTIDVFVHQYNVSTSELIYRYFQKDIPRERVWIAIYGAIGDYSDDTPFVKERILNWDRRALYFEVSTITLGIKNDEFSDYDSKRRIVSTLAEGRNPSDVPGLVKSAKEAVNREFELYRVIKKKAKSIGSVGYILDLPSFGFRGPSALFAATVTNKPVGISAHTREKYIDITIRTRDYSLSLNDLAERSAEFVGGSGGGHPHAAGAKIPKGSFQEFLKKFNELLGR